jgi:hypothetical protein
MVELVLPVLAAVEPLRWQISSVSGFEDAPHVFSGTEFGRLVCLFFGSAKVLLLTSSFDFHRLKGATMNRMRLLLCFISTKGWELPVIPIYGMDSGRRLPCWWRWKEVQLFLLERMPMVVQRDRCGLAWFCAIGFCVSTCVGSLW